ncbi:hypothetical protein SAMN06265171_106265 [Chryseobacterium rhizoplanae]|uniref:Uncharacterized protein n=1 Tax=Chryseobacterium rhizoplanae TaxID=1609531 RepID=A0A521E087_9FLAO|nr:hypothetical protein [Chryseobacterium rhizoplanae]SMO77364.1 hypothetical protein SAMN06265171_106265 [Chryseobacterium rhizoplanae]
MKNDFELDESSKKPLLIFGLIFGSIVFITVFYLSYNAENLTKKVILDEKRHSRIISIFRAKEEHNFIYIKLSGGQIYNFNNLYRVGDSLSKSKGDSIEYIFRGDSIIKNNLFEVARREGTLK